MSDEIDLEQIAKRRGFFWPSFEIYGGCAGFYTYGPVGAILKRNIENMLIDHFLVEEKCAILEAPVLGPEEPWIASGHVESFGDVTIECEKCGESYRADHLIKEHTGKHVEGFSIGKISEIVKENKIKCPKCSGKLANPYNFNIMFKTLIGPGKNKVTGYLRGETAQTTYIPFKRLFNIGRKKLPMGVIQVGKSFRNEISPRKGLIRLREFSQAEVQFFIHPKTKNNWDKIKKLGDMELNVFTKKIQETGSQPKKMSVSELSKKTNQMIAYFLGVSVKLFQKMGIDGKKLVLRQHKDDELSFYSNDTWDVEYKSDNYGNVELVGIADRTDYDLKRHQEVSGEKMQVSVDGDKFVPHVLEVAYGIDRPLLCAMESCLNKDEDRIYFSFPPHISPYQVAVFPLVSKKGLPEKSMEIFEKLRDEKFYVVHDSTGSIGKRYYRQDEIGTPYCITIDFDTLEDNTVTIRDRDTQEQIRVKSDKLSDVLRKLFLGKKLEDFD